MGLDNVVAVVDLITGTVARTIPLEANLGPPAPPLWTTRLPMANPNLNTVTKVNSDRRHRQRGRWRVPEGCTLAAYLRDQRQPGELCRGG
jgi:hypothetical protein